MRALTRRRTINISITMLISIAILAIYAIGTATLVTGSDLSGWMLAGLIIFLALYNLRKSLPFLPLGSSAQWLQLHIYIGFLTFVLFAVHLGLSLPHGIFESLLALLYLLVFLSGVCGLYITRAYPRRLTNLGEEAIFEQIPVLQRNIRTEIERSLLECAAETEGSELPVFYRDHLHDFVTDNPDYLSHLALGRSRKWRKLTRKISDQTRYLNEQEREVLAGLLTLLERKHELDTQRAFQGALKIWLFLHIPATYTLLVFMVFHVILVHAWSGEAG